jgi:hypothetical protein
MNRQLTFLMFLSIAFIIGCGDTGSRGSSSPNLIEAVFSGPKQQNMREQQKLQQQEQQHQQKQRISSYNK